MSPRRSIGSDVTSLIEVSGRQALSVQQFELRVCGGPHKGRSARSEERELTVGSSPGCDLVLEDDTAVSRNHFVVRATQEGFELLDLGSRNGTWVGDLRVHRAVLSAESFIDIGRSRLKFLPLRDRALVTLSDEDSFGELLGRSAKMREVFARLRRAATVHLSVLIEGESGTGKELAARALHEHSPRTGGPFEVFDCAAVAPTVIESELFGHEKGAFTGAESRYAGVFERADGGTLFLDEIGELRTDLQPRLLRVLETGEFRRVGGSHSVRVDVRVIAATNRDLRIDVNQGLFRLDLYHRLAAMRIRMPALAERVEDIPLLVARFAEAFAERQGWPSARGVLSPSTVALLEGHRWPGNVRELRHFVEQALVLADLADLPGREDSVQASRIEQEALRGIRYDVPYKEAREAVLDAFTRAYFEQALNRTNRNITRLAREAGIDRVYAQRIVKKLGL